CFLLRGIYPQYSLKRHSISPKGLFINPAYVPLYSRRSLRRSLNESVVTNRMTKRSSGNKRRNGNVGKKRQGAKR
ncbi:hypothetical protein P879_02816, partial [Paragonimus westermani]